MTEPLVRRTIAAQATLDKWSTRPFRLGKSDCVRMAADHLRRLGYKVKLPPSGSYGTVRGAVKALKAAGHASLPAALDAMGLERIAPAATIAGDLIMLPGEGDLGGLSICLGNGRALSYHEEAITAVVIQPIEFVAAWRVEPRK